MNELKPFMMTKDWKICDHIYTHTHEKRDQKKMGHSHKEICKKDPFFIPKGKDPLFWIFYIIHYGWEGYETPNATSFENEKEKKFEWIQILRENKSILKEKKVKNIREDIENELANQQKIGMKTFMALCMASKKNILYIHKRKCFDLVSNPDSTTYFVVHQERDSFALEYEAGEEKWNMYKKDYIPWESLDKPIKAISSYKMEELVALYERAVSGAVSETKNKSETNGKKLSKKELYEVILKHI